MKINSLPVIEYLTLKKNQNNRQTHKPQAPQNRQENTIPIYPENYNLQNFLFSPLVYHFTLPAHWNSSYSCIVTIQGQVHHTFWSPPPTPKSVPQAVLTEFCWPLWWKGEIFLKRLAWERGIFMFIEWSLLFPFSSITIINRKMLQEMTDFVTLITHTNVYAQLCVLIHMHSNKH